MSLNILQYVKLVFATKSEIRESSSEIVDWVTGKLSGKADTSHTHNDMEVNTNKVTSITSSSTNTQYPSAKSVYDFVTDYIDSLDGDDNDW